MTYYNRNGEKKKIAHEFRRHVEEDVAVSSLCRLGRPVSPRSMQEEEKRIRREIANSNERRRMQSINAGFQYLRKLLPHREGEKLSKASILQQTADFIYTLEQDKTCLLEQNCQLKRRIIDSQNSPDSDGSCSDAPFPKRRKRDLDSADEGIGSSPPHSDSTIEDGKREVIELKQALDRERAVRFHLEEQIKKLEARLGIAENVYNVALQDHVSYHSSPESIGKSRIINIVMEEGTIPCLNTVKVEDFHEVPVSPELPLDDIPEDLSGRNDSASQYDKDTITNSGTVLQLTPLPSPPAFSVELEVTSQQKEYKLHRSRPNLETIVEAIRHVEGDHMFRDDPSPRESPIRVNEPEETNQELCDNQTFQTQLSQTLSLQHKIIRNAPISQSRPGVIVSKLS